MNPLNLIHEVARRWSSHQFATKYARLFFAMSMDQAKATLGFPPNANPTPLEVSKAFKSKAIENHPDRGGSHEKMVEINIAKDILDGTRMPDGFRRQRPDPSPRPKPEPWPEEKLTDFNSAKSEAGIPMADWKFASVENYARVETKINPDDLFSGRAFYYWVVYGQTSSAHVFVLVTRRIPTNDHEKKIRYTEEWKMDKATFPIAQDIVKLAPKAIKQLLGLSLIHI